MIQQAQKQQLKFYQNEQLQSKFWKLSQSQQTKSSQFYKRYAQFLKPTTMNLQKHQQALSINGIKYTATSPYYQFHFDIERMVPNLDFYRLHVKISHFKLIVNIAIYNETLLQSEENIEQYKSKIQFISLRGKPLCFKIHSFGKKRQFHKIFTFAIKEWTILKICSVLQCGPYLQNYLGFDIIVYNDCVKFAMEKGRQIKQISNFEINQLKEELKLMHQFKIIHGDIKPDNIIFSHHFNKLVFIDFGFSEIIKQKLGEKTVSSFKGTPNFCTAQMLALMLQTNGLIDLYYNDAYGLGEVSRYMGQKQNEIHSQQSDWNHSLEKNALLYQDQSKYLLYAFHYHYINENQLKLQQLLKNSIDIEQVLLFINKASNHIFLSNIFYQTLQPYSNSIQYKQIQQKNKYNAEAFYLRRNKNQQITRIQGEQGEQVLNLLSSQMFNSTLQHQNYQHYMKMILTMTKLQSQFLSNLIGIIFESVRFDIKNLDFQDKLKIANKVNPLLLSYKFESKQVEFDYKLSGDYSKMKQIKLLMRLIFKFCLCSKPCKWIRDHLFDVYQQIIIINDVYHLFLARLITYIEQNSASFQSILVIFELYRLYQSTKMINTQYSQAINDRFVSEIQKLIYKFKKTNENSKDIETNSILKILVRIDKDKSYNNDQQYSYGQQYLEHIKNPSIRKYCLYYILNNKIKSLFELGRAGQVIKMIQIIKRSIEIYSLDLLSRSKIIITLMYLTNNQMVLDYYKYVASIVNCHQIYTNFNIEKYIPNKETIQQRIDKIIRNFAHFGENIYYELLSTLLNVSVEDTLMNNQLQNQLIVVYKQYQIYKYQQFKDCRKIQTFSDTFFAMQVQLYFYQISTQTQTIFLSTLQQLQQQFSQDKGQSQHLKLILKYKLFLYKYYHYIELKDYQNCFYYLQKIIYICESIGLNFIVLQVIKALSWVSWKWSTIQIIIFSAQKLYKFCKSNNQFIFYLLPIHQPYTLNTLSIFAAYNKTDFQQLLLNLTHFLSLNPTHATKIYFDTLLKIIDEFLKENPQQGYLIHYSKFQGNNQNNLNNNPYLLIFYAYSFYNQQNQNQIKLLKKFALNCDYLSNFAKKKLLQRYFSVFISFLWGENQRKRLCVFREAKNFIIENDRRRQAKLLLRTSKQNNNVYNIFHQLLRQKANNIIKMV